MQKKEKLPAEILRPLFAAIALHAIIPRATTIEGGAKDAVKFADALIFALGDSLDNNMLNVAQFRDFIVDPVLKQLGLYSVAASNLLVGTALQESRLTYLKQVNGPALGLFQMEPATFRDIEENYLKYNLKLYNAVNALCVDDILHAEQMVGNLYLATAMCRIHYLRVEAPLPDAIDFEGLALYYKQYYNTYKGKATVQAALPHFKAAIDV